MPIDVILARVVHVMGVVVWIGGVVMVTTVVLPAIERGRMGNDPVAAFAAVEERFSVMARIAVFLVGASGLYMIWRLDLWDRFAMARFWWMHAMVCVWAVFALILFVAEPLVLKRRLNPRAGIAPRTMVARLRRGHWILMSLALAVVAGATAGVQGWPP